MKKKALVVALLCVMGLAALSITNAEAEWFTCTISSAGSNWLNYQVTLSHTGDPAFTDRPFIIDTSNNHGKEIYAAALTALANSSQVSVFLTKTTPLSLVWGIYALK